MAEVLRYIHTNSTAGGNGTTNALTGANRAYASATEWEAAEQTNLVTDGDTHRVLCSGTTADSFLILAGWITGSSNFITFESNPDDPAGRNFGNTYSDSHYRLEPTTNDNDIVISAINFTIIIGIQLKPTSFVANGKRLITVNAADDVTIDSCRLNMDQAGKAGWFGIQGSTLTQRLCILNTLIDNIGSNFTGLDFPSLTEVSYSHNNTVIGATFGIKTAGTDTVSASNNLVYNCGTSYVGDFDSASDNNSTDNAETTGGSNDRQNQSYSFEDEAGSNYVLKPNDTGALQKGANLSAHANCPVITDLRSRNRSGAYDIGAFQYISRSSLGTSAGLTRGLRAGLTGLDQV